MDGFRKQALLKWTARGLFALAAAIAVQHFLAHAGYRPLPMSMGSQDLLVGYPLASAIAIVALLVWGRKPMP